MGRWTGEGGGVEGGGIVVHANTWCEEIKRSCMCIDYIMKGVFSASSRSFLTQFIHHFDIPPLFNSSHQSVASPTAIKVKVSRCCLRIPLEL